MDQQSHTDPTGPNGRRFHIAHRRSPSELTPLTAQQLSIAQQFAALQQHQQRMNDRYYNLGMLQPYPVQDGFNSMQGQGSNVSVPYQYLPQQMQQQHPAFSNPSAQAQHHDQSTLLNLGDQQPTSSMGPAGFSDYTSMGTSGFSDYNSAPSAQGRENMNPRGRGGNSGGGHVRRHSLALPEARKAAELAEQKRKAAGFQFPIPGSTDGSANNRPSSPASVGASESGLSARASSLGPSHGRSKSMASNSRVANQRSVANFQYFPSTTNEGGTSSNSGRTDFHRRGSQGHSRTGSRNFEGNWRQPKFNQQQQQQNQAGSISNFNLNQASTAAPFHPGHHSRGSMASQSVSSIGSFQPPNRAPLVQVQGPLVQPPLMQTHGLNSLSFAQLQMPQAVQINGQRTGLPVNQYAPQISIQQQQQPQQRKTLFTPYLPQATLPALLSDGQLVAGILRVNKKNRSDAYVTTTDLDADIFICGSKDRNRALEGDLVAVELLDVEEVWGQKREKEEKKKRKDNSDTRGGSIAVNDATIQRDTSQSRMGGGIRRRGSLRQRPTQKRRDDVEVEGQSLLLPNEEEINDGKMPLYAGHVVAVIERIAGQMFSGTLGLLRPSSQATKEKQEAERQAREGSSSRPQPERQQEVPKIVWFKPTDKRVPLIAIPTEQAPRDFVEKHYNFANRIFIACIKRWPITSLHPFGTLVEQLGEMGDLKVETDALLRDNNFGPDDFSDAVLRSVGFEDWSVSNDGADAFNGRRDFRDENCFTIDPMGSEEMDNAIHFKVLPDGHFEIGVHVADVANFVKENSLVDREAKRRGTAVHLMNRTVTMLPSKLSADVCCLQPGEERYTISVVFKVDSDTGRISQDETWIGKAVIKSSGKHTYDQVDAIINGLGGAELSKLREEEIRNLHNVTKKFRQSRLGNCSQSIYPLRLLYQLDDENIPVKENIFNSSPAHELIEELAHKANGFVAKKLLADLPEKALLRRQSPPNPRLLQTFLERMTAIGYEIDTTSSGTLQNSLFSLGDAELRKGMETLLVKSMQRAKYFIAGKTNQEYYPHYALNMPVYTHFTSPSRRYADIVVHRQLEVILSNGSLEYQEDIDALAKTAEVCNTKKDSAHSAQEQSVHIEACRRIDKMRRDRGIDLISEAIVLCVYESAFDVLIPEFGFEKRVHCDQLPLRKAEFDKNQRLLELYWEKGVPSSTFIPEEEKFGLGPARGANAALAAREVEESQRSKDLEEAQHFQVDTGTISSGDVDALFQDDYDAMSEITEITAGVSLNPLAADRPTQSMPHSPTRVGMYSGQFPHRTKSDSKLSQSTSDIPEGEFNRNIEKYSHMLVLREVKGDYIQDIREMSKVPVLLKTDLSKSPPCLTIRSLNPYAL